MSMQGWMTLAVNTSLHGRGFVSPLFNMAMMVMMQSVCRRRSVDDFVEIVMLF
jgi:hypothetical protein